MGCPTCSQQLPRSSGYRGSRGRAGDHQVWELRTRTATPCAGRSQAPWAVEGKSVRVLLPVYSGGASYHPGQSQMPALLSPAKGADDASLIHGRRPESSGHQATWPEPSGRGLWCLLWSGLDHRALEKHTRVWMVQPARGARAGLWGEEQRWLSGCCP